MTRSAVREHIADGIRINVVGVGSVDTTMSLLPGETVAGRTERLRNPVPIGRVATTDEVANAVLWSTSQERASPSILDGRARV